MEIRVYYEDTDLGGVVYHSNYINFCERARSELFFSEGKTPVLANGHFVAKELHANFLQPAKFADILHVKTSLLSMKGASFELLQEIFREEEKLFSMTITLVFVNNDGKAQRMDGEVKAFLSSLSDS